MNFQIATKEDYLREQEFKFYPTKAQAESLIVHVLQTETMQHHLIFDYQKQGLEEWEIQTLQEHITNVIFELINRYEKEKKDTLLSDYKLYSEEEKEKVINGFNDTKQILEYKTIDAMFDEHVRKNGNKTALILENKKVSYQQLYKRANYVAKKLIENNVSKGDFVAVLATKSIETIVAMLGVMKAGAIYVPIDPEYPNERIQYILENCEPNAILYTNHSRIDTEIPFIVVGCEETEETIVVEHTPFDIAYMIYTSGTTGKPKGVLVEHHGIAALKDYFIRERGYTNNDVIMQFASFSFDAAISEITMSLLIGGTLCIVTEDLRNDIDELEVYLEKNQVTIGLFPPQYLAQIKKIPFRLLLTAGSETNHAVISKFATNRVYSNDYGPTEATVCATAWRYDGGELPHRIPIGKPITNKRIYILNEDELCGIGIPGELCIAGDGIARGYFKQKELTEQKFVEDPFIGGKMYRTGDLARWTMDGNIEFLGRIDNQVKIRGFRIEIGEIENVMRNCKDIVDAAVVVRHPSDREAYLEAYYVGNENASYESLIKYMRENLPNYMIPAYTYQVSEIPLNRNGKVDAQKLPTYIMERKKEHIQPKNEVQEIILYATRKVVGNQNIGLEDNFFEVGGDSLKAIALISELKSKNIYTNVKQVISNASLFTLCQEIEQTIGSVNISVTGINEKAEIGKEYPLTAIQQEIYLGAILDAQGIAYNVPMVVKFKQKLNVNKEKEVLQIRFNDNVALRAGFKQTEEGLVEIFRDSHTLDIPVEQTQDVKASFDEFLKPFNLENDEIFRVKILEDEVHSYLMFDSHHIVVDGISMGLLFKSFISLYEEDSIYKVGEYDFADYVNWCSSKQAMEINEQALTYWKKKFQDGVEKNLIPTDYERTSLVGNQGETLYFNVQGELLEAINEFGVKNNATSFMTLMGVFCVLVHKLTMDKKLVIGVPTSGRFIEDTSDMVGMFVSSIPFMVEIDREEKFSSLVKKVGENLAEALSHQNCTLNQIANEVDLASENGQNPFFAMMFGVNDVEFNKQDQKTEFELMEFEQNMAKFDITLDANKDHDKVQFVLRYNKELYKQETMSRFMKYYLHILKQVTQNEDLIIKEVNVLSDEEQEELLLNCNDNKIDFKCKDSNVIKLFTNKAKEIPEQIAVAFDGNYLTYGELDNYSSLLAENLEEKGCKKGKIIPILTQRSFEMLIMEFAVMKIGAAFCPMDPAWPLDRKKYIYEQLEAEFLLTGPGCEVNELPQYHVDMNQLQGKANKDYNGENINGADTFYVIYTSGSTGQPKGVVVPYRGIMNRLMWMNETLELRACKSVLLTTNYVYDSSIWQFYWPLINGGKTVIPNPDDMLTADYLLAIIRKEQIGIVDFVPSVFNTIVEDMEKATDEKDALDSLVWVILGGEAIKPKAVNRFLTLFPKLKCINLYGPTEASIGCIYKVLEGNNNTNIPIGKPISNVDILILDKDMNLVPNGISGEIYIGGICLADGYLADEEKTNNSFVKNPFKQIQSERLYKTGDIAKRDSTGDIFYLGRSDSQVKIRGFRIELQEVEAKVLECQNVKECIVLDLERGQDDKVLCAYYTGEAKEADIKASLQAKLPGYMVPSYFMKLDKIAISASGKANRKALPMPDFTIQRHAIVVPVNRTEEIILEAWKKVLHQDEISTDDNYFEIGGDSIKALQVVSLLRKENIEFTMQQLFVNPTIKQLAEIVTESKGSDKSSTFAGELALAPIQKRFFARYDSTKFFNQSVLLENDEEWKQDILVKAWNMVVQNHPMLNSSFELKEDKEWVQTISVYEEGMSTIHTFEKEDADSLDEIILELQNRIHITERIIELSVFTYKNKNYLFFTAHHLVIDAVSMRIIMNEVLDAYMQMEKGNQCELQREDKTYKDFVAICNGTVPSKWKMQNSYWEEIDQIKDRLASNPAKNTFGSLKNCSIELDETVTKNIVSGSNSAYGTRTEEIILAAFANAVSKQNLIDGNQLVIDMEQNGRNISGNEMDFFETVGWFTAIYPVCLRKDVEELRERIISTKECLRAVPDKGVYYQILHYHDTDVMADADICFNYLGELSVSEEPENIHVVDLNSHLMVHPEMPMPYSMDVSIGIRENKLFLSIDYVQDKYAEESMDNLLEEFRGQCSNINVHCLQQKEIVKTPADFGRSELSMEELHTIFTIADGDVEKIYPLSATQEGMLFHAIAQKDGGSYFEQNYLTLEGNLDYECFEKAYSKLIETYDIFRTVFLYEQLPSTYQVVKAAKDVEFNISMNDLTLLTPDKQEETVQEYCKLDKQKGFELSQGSLMRVKIFKTASNTWKIVWSDHHILMDGWCLKIVIDKLMDYYKELTQGKELKVIKPVQYSEYIEWLQKQDMEDASAYWKKQLSGYTRPNELYKLKGIATDKQTEQIATVNAEISHKLMKEAKDRGVTLNACMQAAWAVTLMRYCDTQDVVYGSVVSGRSADIEGVESIVGLFISTLPVRVQALSGMRFMELAKQVMASCADADKYSYYPLAEVQKYTEYGNELFDHIFVFENYEFIKKGAQKEQLFKIVEASAEESTNYDMTIVVLPREELQISFTYKESVFASSFVSQMMRHYQNVLAQIADNMDCLVDELEVLDEIDYTELNMDEAFSIGYPHATIHSIFEEQVRKYPEKIAITYEDENYTYKEVDNLANRIANTLLKKGIQKRDIVGILIEKGAKAIITALGILKAGGVYMPLDPGYPIERLEFMIEDSQASYVIMNHENYGILIKDKCIDWSKDIIEDISRPEVALEEETPAYIIYTSGTTGKPKGAMISHKNVVRLFFNDQCIYDFTEEDIWVMFHSFSFDFSVWEMYGALLYGGRLIIISKDFARDTYKFVKMLESEKVTVLNQTPSAFNSLSLQLELEPNTELKVRYLIFGGEKLHPAVLKSFHNSYPECRIINMYGITETTVHVSYKEISDEEIKTNVSDIGVPIPTLGILLADSRLKPVPKGMQGEILVWGEGVCLGYIRRPELTEKKFIQYQCNGREVYTYRSGDTGRYIEGGLEYIGRIDHQVKIRGHRIELGEIKNAILKNDKIEDCIILVDETADQEKYVVAYYQKKKEIDVHKLRRFLEDYLPEYMMPAYFIEIQEIPLNQNGKVDRKALPKPEVQVNQNNYAKPENEMQEYVVNVWQDILKYEPIGIDDNYFEIGGDSIKVIKILSRMHSDGYQFEVADLFAHPTIREFYTCIHANKNVYEQDEISGEARLTPVQQRLVQDEAIFTEQYNQAVMLHTDEHLVIESLQYALKQIVIHHDALRCVYDKEQSCLKYRTVEECPNIDEIKVVDLQGMNEEQVNGTIQERCDKEEAKVHLGASKLYSMTVFVTDSGDYILFIVHHMVVDVVSWSAISEDLVALYYGKTNNQVSKLLSKTMSFKEWGELMNSAEFQQEMRNRYTALWKMMAGKKASAVFDTTDYGTFSDTKSVHIELSPEETKELTEKSLAVTGANMEEVLLTLVLRGVIQCTGQECIAIDLESNGRIIRYKEYDLSRTVGWFTAIYPMVVENETDVISMICQTKENRRKVRNIEYTFGLLNMGDKEKTSFVVPQLSFNYLGEISSEINGFERSNLSIGKPVGDKLKRWYAIDISCSIQDGILRFSLDYSKNVVSDDLAEKIADTIKAEISNAIIQLREQNDRIMTPSDYNVELSMDELDYLHVLYGDNIETMMKMTPMQKGMLYHAISNEEDDAYYINLDMKLSGNVEPEKFQKAVEKLVEEYSCLRTIFVNENIVEPVQIVLKKQNAAFTFLDARNLTQAQREERKNEFNKERFSYASGSLSAFFLMQTENEKYDFVWKFHHLILDGWSLSVLLERLFQEYMALQQTGDAELVMQELGVQQNRDSSADLYRWIAEQDIYEAKEFFKKYLGGRELDTSIPFEKTVEQNQYAEKEYFLDEAYTDKLNVFRNYNITDASVVMSAWGIMLALTNLEEYSVFGSTVSGRGGKVEDLGSAVGMFINTVPVCVSIEEGENFIDSARRFQEELVQMEQYSYYPLYEIQSDINHGNPIINHVVAYENYPVNQVLKQKLGDDNEYNLSIDNVVSIQQINYGFGVVFTPGKKLKLQISYNECAITTEQCDIIADMFFNILQQVIDNPAITKEQMKLLNDKQISSMSHTYEKPAYKSLLGQFADACKGNADGIAVMDEERSLSYRELDYISNALAEELKAAGVKKDEVVCLMSGPSVSQAVGILGIMKSNAVYMPVDIKLPKDRIEYMLSNSQAVRIVCDNQNESFAKQFNLPVSVISLDSMSEKECVEEGKNAYIIYTSGTTGKPKGVLVSRENIAASIGWRSKEYALSSEDTILQLFSNSFDGFMTSFFTPLVSGSKIVLIKDVLDVRKIGEVIESEKVTHFICVPMLCQTIFENLTEEQLKSVRMVTTAGDRLGEQTYQIIKDKNQNIEVINEYGPTECSVVSTIKRNVGYADIMNNSIGNEITGAYIYIMDNNRNLLPVGLDGEIVIGGSGVAQGYINAQELTNKVFIENPYIKGEKLYRSGDKGRRLPNGEIAFSGRIDKQVKVRGYRIEILEIEKAMEQLNEVSSAAIKVVGENIIVYYTGNADVEEIRVHLEKELPKYMLPAKYIQVEEMPLTFNGKKDYKSLPEPKEEDREVIMPKNDIEWQIYDIWEEVLGHQNFGVTDNFFEVGGNSIRLMNVLGKLEKLYPKKFTVASLFAYTSIADIAEFISSESLEEVIDEFTDKLETSDDTVEDLEASILAGLEDDDVDLDELMNKFGEV